MHTHTHSRVSQERLKRKRRERELEREERRVKAEQLTSAWIERKRQEELKEKTVRTDPCSISTMHVDIIVFILPKMGDIFG